MTVGMAVFCKTCGRRKKPVGRDSRDNGLCDHECPGYRDDPEPGWLWPGERDESHEEQEKMAEIDTTKCVHCWHSIWWPSTYQAGQYSAHEQQCCWCGQKTPLSVGVATPQRHGPHKPPSLPQMKTVAGGSCITRAPTLGPDGIPLPSDKSPKECSQ